MIRHYIAVLLFLSTLNINAVRAHDKSNDVSSSRQSLVRWCNIQPTQKTRIEISNHLKTPNQRLQPETVYLFRKGYSGCVAVIQIDWTGHGKLNPEGFYYGTVPTLSEITPAEVEQLWGSTPSEFRNPSDIRKYSLLDESGTAYEITLHFKGKRLTEYRIEGERGRPFGWSNVQ